MIGRSSAIQSPISYCPLLYHVERCRRIESKVCVKGKISYSLLLKIPELKQHMRRLCLVCHEERESLVQLVF
ncbi:Uncharacterized protein TCM_031845 [Theobroma cacao]|uniref:Uncharacterized protein n=1 Tax=Theobroma cacao TaxID=3641 RepID=A0A061F8U7_THECC|nr:Uncharacterized protein TCM_031845 [Theobroma cacao]